MTTAVEATIEQQQELAAPAAEAAPLPPLFCRPHPTRPDVAYLQLEVRFDPVGLRVAADATRQDAVTAARERFFGESPLWAKVVTLRESLESARVGGARARAEAEAAERASRAQADDGESRRLWEGRDRAASEATRCEARSADLTRDLQRAEAEARRQLRGDVEAALWALCRRAREAAAFAEDAVRRAAAQHGLSLVFDKAVQAFDVPDEARAQSALPERENEPEGGGPWQTFGAS